jgi:steroid 5-alpha reductase family enzyme
MNLLVVNLIVIGVLMVSVWLLSVILRDASIVDIVWGLGFVVVAWSSAIASESNDAVDLVIRLCVTVWGLRLAGYLAWRNLGKGEDFRYRAMRKKYGARFPLVSLVTVFALQGLLMWVVSLPIQLAHMVDGDVVFFAVVGVAVWVVGLSFEAIGDAQLARFKRNPENAGKVMNAGLWRYTRHPNYFGDFLVWWGVGIASLAAWSSVIGLLGPLVMSILLMRVSGVPMLEHSIDKRRPGYDEYRRSTSAFFPRPTTV